MKGLELSRAYFEQIGKPALAAEFPEYMERIAAGLVGEGSECFGFDDSISQDHDFGPSFCIWLNKPDYDCAGGRMQQLYDSLPQEFTGFSARQISRYAGKRVGVFETGSFYRRFIGMDRPPQTLAEWRRIPESALAAATNGAVFQDGPGEFSAFRQSLLNYYPEDVRLKKISARCVSIAQSGQYNYLRCLSHGEYVAAEQSRAIFTEAAISMVFLLNKRYKPFYKWMHRALLNLPVLGVYAHDVLLDICRPQTECGDIYEYTYWKMEDLCQKLIQELKNQGLTGSDSSFMLDHAPEAESRIQDAALRSLGILEE